MERKTKEVCLTVPWVNYDNYTITEFNELLQKTLEEEKQRTGSPVTEPYISIGLEWDDYENCDPTVTLTYDREETDKEYNIRMAVVEVRRKNREKKKATKISKKDREERDLYEKLKKKYEGK
jgi:hypothetical protein